MNCSARPPCWPLGLPLGSAAIRAARIFARSSRCAGCEGTQDRLINRHCFVLQVKGRAAYRFKAIGRAAPRAVIRGIWLLLCGGRRRKTCAKQCSLTIWPLAISSVTACACSAGMSRRKAWSTAAG